MAFKTRFFSELHNCFVFFPLFFFSLEILPTYQHDLGKQRYRQKLLFNAITIPIKHSQIVNHLFGSAQRNAIHNSFSNPGKIYCFSFVFLPDRSEYKKRGKEEGKTGKTFFFILLISQQKKNYLTTLPS